MGRKILYATLTAHADCTPIFRPHDYTC
jgi:hypothetical protein